MSTTIRKEYQHLFQMFDAFWNTEECPYCEGTGVGPMDWDRYKQRKSRSWWWTTECGFCDRSIAKVSSGGDDA